MPPRPDLMDRHAAAEYLSISVATLDRYRKAGLVPSIQKGRNRGQFVRFFKSDLDKFLTALKPA